MGFRLIFSRRRFDAIAMKRLANDIVHLLTAIAVDPEQRLAALWPSAACADTSYQAPKSDTVSTPSSVSPS
jgi:hypothetical protein